MSASKQQTLVQKPFDYGVIKNNPHKTVVMTKSGFIVRNIEQIKIHGSNDSDGLIYSYGNLDFYAYLINGKNIHGQDESDLIMFVWG